MKKHSDWLFFVAKQALEGRLNYSCIITLAGNVIRGTNTESLLRLVQKEQCAETSTLYTFCEPDANIRRLAKSVGIAAIYYALHVDDVRGLIDAGHPFSLLGEYDDTVVDTGDLKVSCIYYVRRDVLQLWLNVTLPSRPKEQSPTYWLRKAAIKARERRTNYFYVVIDGVLLAEGVDFTLNVDVRGAIVYSFRPLTSPELGYAEDEGI